MKHIGCALIVAVALASAIPASAAPQGMRVEEVTQHPAEVAGISVAAALVNIVYSPVRFAVTLVTAEVGGLTAWLNGGDRSTAHAVWNLTDGQAFVTPAMLQGRERWRFGSDS
jgi:hypothetical protein